MQTIYTAGRYELSRTNGHPEPCYENNDHLVVYLTKTQARALLSGNLWGKLGFVGCRKLDD